jgi:hypothetical protein
MHACIQKQIDSIECRCAETDKLLSLNSRGGVRRTRSWRATNWSGVALFSIRGHVVALETLDIPKPSLDQGSDKVSEAALR